MRQVDRRFKQIAGDGVLSRSIDHRSCIQIAQDSPPLSSCGIPRTVGSVAEAGDSPFIDRGKGGEELSSLSRQSVVR